METEKATSLRDLAVQCAQAGRDLEADATFAEALTATRAIKGQSMSVAGDPQAQMVVAEAKATLKIA